MDRLQMSCEHVSLELRPKTSETVSSVYKIINGEGAVKLDPAVCLTA